MLRRIFRRRRADEKQPHTKNHLRLSTHHSWALMTATTALIIGVGSGYLGVTEPGPLWQAILRCIAGAVVIIVGITVAAWIMSKQPDDDSPASGDA